MPGVIGRAMRPEQLHGSLHQLDLRDVFCLVEAQKIDDVFVGNWSFHRTLSGVPERPPHAQRELVVRDYEITRTTILRNLHSPYKGTSLRTQN